MFGISMWELLLILAVALVVLGPRQLAETARYMGKLYRDLQRMTLDLRSTIDLDEHILPGHQSAPYGGTPTKPAPVAAEAPRAGDAKSGPDFYAQLLEQSRTDDEGQDSSKAKPDDTAPGKPVDLTKKGPRPSAVE